MYDELVKRLRCLKYGSCPDCPMWYSEEVEPNLWRARCAAIDAADAIEKLQQENDFLKGMQKQIVRGISNKELGQMVYRELRRGGHV